ncbi:MAG: polyribonucleotide nucleotidyltransferase [Clostridia bacterium]|nr:polyribonucleotide nucleotidyltransferase [Clostridia bacterium]
MFENYRVFSTTLAGRKLTVETGKIAQLANGSCLVRYGDTAILATATASASPREGIDFLPLSVDFEERLYAVGKIPGSFLKREGKPSEKAILTSRVIDRPIRPLFPKDLRNDVTLNLLVLSVDPDCSPEVTGLIGASLALSISDIPWNGPVSSVFVGMVDDEIIINPTAEQRAKSTLELTVASSAKKVVMIEAGGKEIPDDTMFDAIMKAHEVNTEIVKFIEHVQAEVGKKKFDYPSCDVDHDLYDKIADFAIEKIRYALDTPDKNIREDRLNAVYAEVDAFVTEQYPGEDRKAEMGECLYKLQKFVVRRWLLDDGKRVDGRTLDEIRPLAAEVGLFNRTHGSAMFTRGQTQVVTVATLGLVGEQQLLDGIDEEEYKRYMHHYNMPSYSVGETKPSRGPGRREIGHGALAERALVPVIPTVEDFPYSIRLVSEVVSSNGSTSQGSICASTLALMDAGVPITAPVAGISCGLITEGDRWMTMIDIQGLEDFFGDMDFKVAGTKKGITAIQMDLKIDGLTPEIIKAAFAQTHKGRDYILDEVMLKAIDKPRAEVSEYAPKMITIKIDPEKIGDVIGKSGKVIQAITAETGAKIDIEDDGTVFIAAIDKNAGLKAKSLVEAIAFDPEPGTVFTGKVTRIMSFGAFVEIAPGKEGLVHISKLDSKRVEKVEDVVNVGDEIKVKVLELDDKGRLNLSRKDCF